MPPDAVGASIPIIFAATGLGLLLATAWSAAVGATVVASIFAISAAAAVHAQGLFLITWLVIIGTLTMATLRLPLAFTVLFVLIDATLALVLAATINASTDLSKAGGVGALAFAAVGAYIYLAVIATATGGKALPLGRPVLR